MTVLCLGKASLCFAVTCAIQKGSEANVGFYKKCLYVTKLYWTLYVLHTVVISFLIENV